MTQEKSYISDVGQINFISETEEWISINPETLEVEVSPTPQAYNPVGVISTSTKEEVEWPTQLFYIESGHPLFDKFVNSFTKGSDRLAFSGELAELYYVSNDISFSEGFQKKFRQIYEVQSEQEVSFSLSNIIDLKHLDQETIEEDLSLFERTFFYLNLDSINLENASLYFQKLELVPKTHSSVIYILTKSKAILEYHLPGLLSYLESKSIWPQNMKQFKFSFCDKLENLFQVISSKFIFDDLYLKSSFFFRKSLMMAYNQRIPEEFRQSKLSWDLPGNSGRVSMKNVMVISELESSYSPNDINVDQDTKKLITCKHIVRQYKYALRHLDRMNLPIIEDDLYKHNHKPVLRKDWKEHLNQDNPLLLSVFHPPFPNNYFHVFLNQRYEVEERKEFLRGSYIGLNNANVALFNSCKKWYESQFEKLDPNDRRALKDCLLIWKGDILKEWYFLTYDVFHGFMEIALKYGIHEYFETQLDLRKSFVEDVPQYVKTLLKATFLFRKDSYIPCLNQLLEYMTKTGILNLVERTEISQARRGDSNNINGFVEVHFCFIPEELTITQEDLMEELKEISKTLDPKFNEEETKYLNSSFTLQISTNGVLQQGFLSYKRFLMKMNMLDKSYSKSSGYALFKFA